MFCLKSEMCPILLDNLNTECCFSFSRIRLGFPFSLTFCWPWPIGIEMSQMVKRTLPIRRGWVLAFDFYRGRRRRPCIRRIPCRWRRHGSEHIENSVSFLVDDPRDSLDTATTCKTTSWCPGCCHDWGLQWIWIRLGDDDSFWPFTGSAPSPFVRSVANKSRGVAYSM